MNKYYTPEIEEFHVGFEYEYYKPVVKYDPKWRFEVKRNEFVVKQWTNISANYNWEKDLEEGLLRVKYLDREDIESLGFVPYETDKYEDHYVKDDVVIYLRQHEGELYPIGIFNRQTKQGFSIISIKNKSELKRLLKQLKLC